MAVGVWDTAGSERYEAMSRMYYRNAKAAIVCYAVNDFDSWDKECRPTLTLLEFRRYGTGTCFTLMSTGIKVSI